MRSRERSSALVRGARAILALLLVGFFAAGPLVAPSYAEGPTTPTWETWNGNVPQPLATGASQVSEPTYNFANGTVVVTNQQGQQQNATNWIGSALLWLKNSAVSLLRNGEANTDLVPVGQPGTWSLMNFSWKDGYYGRGWDMAFGVGDTNGDQYWGYAPVYYGAYTPSQKGCWLSIDGNNSFAVTVSTNASTVTPANGHIIGMRIYTCPEYNTGGFDESGGYQNTIRLQWSRTVAIGNWSSNPDRRVMSVGTCKGAAGTAAVTTYSNVFTDLSGIPQISRPDCPTGYRLIKVTASLQTKDTSGTWRTTIPLLFETSWQTSVQDSYPCLTTDTCEQQPPSAGVCPVGTIATPCVAAPGQVVGVSTVTPTATPTPVATASPTTTSGTTGVTSWGQESGKTECRASWNLFDGLACVIEWAFVPKQIDANVAQIKTAVQASPIGTVQTTISMFTTPYTQISAKVQAAPSCLGPAIPMNFVKQGLIIYPFQACEGPNVTASLWVRALSRLVIIISGMYVIVQTILAAFGASQKVFDNADDIQRRTAAASDRDYLRRRFGK